MKVRKRTIWIAVAGVAVVWAGVLAFNSYTVNPKRWVKLRARNLVLEYIDKDEFQKEWVITYVGLVKLSSNPDTWSAFVQTTQYHNYPDPDPHLSHEWWHYVEIVVFPDGSISERRREGNLGSNTYNPENFPSKMWKWLVDLPQRIFW